MTRGSYLLIEPGMTVQGIDGSSIGTVNELIADENADIFRGIVATLSGTSSRDQAVFVPGEHITAVEGQVVFTDLNPDSASQLEAIDSTTTGTDQIGTRPIL